MQKTFVTQVTVIVTGLLSCGLAAAQTTPIETLYGSYVAHGYYGTGLQVAPAGKNVALGQPIVVVCPGAGTCTIQADHFIQVSGACCGAGDFTIGFYLDGVAMPDEQIAGSATPAPPYQVETASELQNDVLPGKHTVRPYVRTTGGSVVFNYTVTFRVYKP